MLTSTGFVKVVLVPIAANAVIGTIVAIWEPGDGSRIGPIGRTMIGPVGAMIKFTSVSRNVMVPPVLIMVIMVIMVMVFIMVIIVCVTIMCVISLKFF